MNIGQNAEAVSRILHVHPKTLKRWVKALASGGEAALTRCNYVGGDGWLTDEQQQQFTTWLDADVRSTAEAIAWVEQQSGLSYSDSGMRKLLKRLDYRYKQLTVLPAKADLKLKRSGWAPTLQSGPCRAAARCISSMPHICSMPPFPLRAGSSAPMLIVHE